MPEPQRMEIRVCSCMPRLQKMEISGLFMREPQTMGDMDCSVFMPQSFQDIYTWTVMPVPPRMEVPELFMPKPQRMEVPRLFMPELQRMVVPGLFMPEHERMEVPGLFMPEHERMEVPGLFLSEP
jgi:hypothetical protein